MIDVFSTTGTIFALILLGYLAVRHGAFSAEDLRVLGKFVISFALPALIFRAVSTRDLGEILNIGYLGGFLIGSLAVMIGGWFWSRRIMGQSSLASTFQAMGMACANSGFVGYPILLMALPGVAATSMAMNMVVENLVLIPLILILAEQAGGTAGKRQVALQIAGRLATSPIILALIAGLAVSVAGIRLPEVVTGPVNLLAAASASVSLMVIGGTLVGLPVRTLDVSVVAVVLGKLIALPLAVWLGLRAMAAIGYPVGDPQLEQAAVLMAATPAMSIYPILAQRYGQENGAAMAMLVMTVLSFFTISLLLFLLAGLGQASGGEGAEMADG